MEGNREGRKVWCDVGGWHSQTQGQLGQIQRQVNPARRDLARKEERPDNFGLALAQVLDHLLCRFGDRLCAPQVGSGKQAMGL